MYELIAFCILDHLFGYVTHFPFSTVVALSSPSSTFTILPLSLARALCCLRKYIDFLRRSQQIKTGLSSRRYLVQPSRVKRQVYRRICLINWLLLADLEIYRSKDIHIRNIYGIVEFTNLRMDS